MPCGISSAIFGCVFGSVFGFEHVLDPLYKALFGLDEKPIEVVSPLEENETKNTTVSAKDKRKRKIRFVAIALVVGVITLTCIWIATRSENKEMPGKQFVDMGDEDVDMPDQAANGFDFEWKD